ncbi:NAD(P)H-binding protein [Winogradskya consettensis]|uniref:NmrA family transcriptional regulator n=1 Tax=Winogradskya consettensis TaxID=113560 RepID=A0A919SUH1_9ACTN|nr:NAD(P)H-binding protein [Actinoplanes consettensis]GIM77839.1 NmrA family transcriptional regulator [Actinoplanes consettensis]
MFVITGATGNVGRVLVRALTEAGEKVVPVSRNGGVRADLSQPETLRPVVQGAEALFLLVSGAGAHLDPEAILGVARDGGVERVVLLSSQAAGTRPDSGSHAPLRVLENAVQGSGLGWTILRPGGFASNAYAWVEPIRKSRTVAAPFGDVGLPVIDPADIAAVADVVLRTGGHDERVYELTGPELSTPRQRAGDIGVALGEPVTFVEQTRDEAYAQMSAFMPPPVAEGTLAILGAPTPAEQLVSPHVEQILGRSPRTFAQWAAGNVQAYR